MLLRIVREFRNYTQSYSSLGAKTTTAVVTTYYLLYFIPIIRIVDVVKSDYLVKLNK